MTKPVYHVAFLTKILKVLRCVCFHCSKLLIDLNDPKVLDIIRKTKRQARQRLTHIGNVCKNQQICKGLNLFQNSFRENFVFFKELKI